MISLLLAWIAGTLLVDALLPSALRGWQRRLLAVSAGVGLGLGLLSSFYFAYLVLFGSAGPAYAVADSLACVALAIAAVLLKARRSPASPETAPAHASSRLNTILHLLLVINLLGAIVTLVTQNLAYPFGNWDGMSTWNLHARVLVRSGEFWRQNYVALPRWSHPDYPLALPGMIARAWQCAGSATQLVPATIAALFTLGSAGILYASLRVLRSRDSAALATLILLGFRTFVMNGGTQYADVPVACFELGAVAMLCLAEFSAEPAGKAPRGPWLLAGLFATLAASTKNDALPFLVGFIGIHALATWRLNGMRDAARKTAWILAGSSPVLVCLIYYKRAIAPPSWVTAGLDGIPWRKLTDLSAHATIAAAFASNLLRFSYALTPPLLLLLYAGLAGTQVPARCRAAAITALLLLPLMLLSFYVVYLISPTELHWQLNTSIDRLLTQIFPTFLFVMFLYTRSPENILQQA